MKISKYIWNTVDGLVKNLEFVENYMVQNEIMKFERYIVLFAWVIVERL